MSPVYMTVSLSRLTQGQVARVVSFGKKPELAGRFLEMGLALNEKVQFLEKLFFGGNLVILSKTGKYSLRKSEADPILVEALADSEL